MAKGKIFPQLRDVPGQMRHALKASFSKILNPKIDWSRPLI